MKSRAKLQVTGEGTGEGARCDCNLDELVQESDIFLLHRTSHVVPGHAGNVREKPLE